jgi:hypothetical protein
VPGSGLQTEFMERTPAKDASAEPSTKDGIEAVRFCAFTPAGSPLDRLQRPWFFLSSAYWVIAGFQRLLKILYTNFGAHDEGDVIVGGAQCRKAAPDSLADLPLVPDDEIGYL